MSFEVSILSSVGPDAVIRDGKYRFTLLLDATFEVHLLVPRGFANAWIKVIPNASTGRTRITFSKGYSWDGCTGVPDGPKNEFGIPRSWIASLFHDGVYQFADSLSTAFGWSVRNVLRFGDDGFHALLLQTWPAASGLYYRGVSILGYPYNRVRWAIRSFLGLFS